MRNATLPAILLLAAAAPAEERPAATEERKEIPVADLVEAPPRRPPVRPVSTLPFALEDLAASAGWLPLGAGEPGLQPLLDIDDLVTVVEGFLEGETTPEAVEPWPLLRVPAARVPAVEGVLARLRAALPADLSVSVVLESGGEGGWRTLLSAEEPLRPGARAVLAEARDRTFVGDFDVEIAQDSQMADPIVHVQRTGASVEVRVHPLPGGRSAVVEAVARVSEPLPREAADTGYPEMGALERGAVAAAEAAAVFRAAPGVEAVQEWRGRDGRAFRLRLTARWTPPPPDPGPWAVLHSPLLAASPPHRRRHGHLLRFAGAEEDGAWVRFGRAEESPRPSPEDRLHRVRERLGPDLEVDGLFTGAGLAVLGGKGAPAAAAALAADLEAEVPHRSFVVEVRRAEGGEERVLFRAAGPVVPGLDVHLHTGEARLFVQDYDVEVAQGSWIPDPIMGLLQTGDFLNLRVVEGPGGAPAAVDLDLQMALLEGFETTEIPVLVAVDRTGGSPSGAPAGAPRRAVYRVERPSVREMRVEGRYPLGPGGKAVLRRGSPAFLGSGREVVVEVTVR